MAKEPPVAGAGRIPAAAAAAEHVTEPAGQRAVAADATAVRSHSWRTELPGQPQAGSGLPSWALPVQRVHPAMSSARSIDHYNVTAGLGQLQHSPSMQPRSSVADWAEAADREAGAAEVPTCTSAVGRKDSCA